jgi:hypothetical protein
MKTTILTTFICENINNIGFLKNNIYIFTSNIIHIYSCNTNKFIHIPINLRQNPVFKIINNIIYMKYYLYDESRIDKINITNFECKFESELTKTDEKYELFTIHNKLLVYIHNNYIYYKLCNSDSKINRTYLICYKEDIFNIIFDMCENLLILKNIIGFYGESSKTEIMVFE